MKRLSTLFFLTSISLFILKCETNLQMSLEENPYIGYHEIQSNDDKILRFALVLPEYYNKDQSYPVLLALPPGEQSQSQVEFGLTQYWVKSSIQRNWIVVSPIAPDGVRFYEGSEELIPDLLDWVEERYLVEGNRFHIAGLSAGGISAFRIAINYPDKFHSLVALPGYPVGEDFDKLNQLQNIQIAMFVGYYDPSSIEEMDKTAQRLDELGIQFTYQLMLLDEHVITSVSSEGWFNLLDKFRPED